MTVCKRCVMDSTALEIKFDKDGYCNFCSTWFLKVPSIMKNKPELVEALFNESRGKTKPYDCLLGVSGGVDSSFVAYLAWKNNMHPLLIHLDNGYDTEESKQNIQRIHEVTGFPLEVIMADAMEFRDIQLAYLKASVINIEAPTDHALAAVTYREAIRHGIKLILNGSNWATEGIRPQSWGYRTDDVTNLKAIHRMFGMIPLRTFPTMSLAMKIYLTRFYGLKVFSPLNYVSYNKQEAEKKLTQVFGWKEYPGKHGESVFTRFFQNFILPEKFGVDKRKMFLSTLICSGQVMREEALKELAQPMYDSELFSEDYRFVLRKLGLTAEEFDGLMRLPVKRHQEYPNEEAEINLVRRLRKWTKRAMMHKGGM